MLVDGRPGFWLHLAGDYVVCQAKDRAAEPGTWHHVAAVFDGRQSRVYLDGERVAAMPASGPRSRNALPLLIGAEPDPKGQPGRCFAGEIDEVRVSRCARCGGESFEPARRHEPDADAVLLLHLDRAVGPFHPDHSPSAAHARATGPVELVPVNGR